MNKKILSVTNKFTESLIYFAKKNKNFIVLDADLSDDLNLKNFYNKYPRRFIQNGIAEQDMISMAGGIARMGLVPIVNSFASFLTARGNEQIYNNATETTKIIYIKSLRRSDTCWSRKISSKLKRYFFIIKYS